MFTKTTITLLLGLAVGTAAQAQTCPCDGGATLLNKAASVQTVLSNKMVCANVGSERWQEWHNGGSSGPVVDYKMGPGHPTDPSATVGSFNIAADGTITYTYGSTSYKYAVCSATAGTFTFCGANFGGRDITGAIVPATAGLMSCSGQKPSPRPTRTGR